MHGAGVIDSIEKRKIDGTEREYYVLKLPVGDMVVMIPKESSAEIGVRPIIGHDAAERIINAIPDIEINMIQNWNKRYRENMIKIKSGDLMEVAEVVKGLMFRDMDRGLSTGERKMLHSAKQILISEIVLAECCSYEEVENRLIAAMV
jgi:CarD family transcriptional regulator